MTRRPAAILALLLAASIVGGVVGLRATAQRAEEDWRALGASWRDWANAAPSGERLALKGIQPHRARTIWVGLEGTTGWPGAAVKEDGSWFGASREVRWIQREGGVEVVARQTRAGFWVETEVTFPARTPPGELVQALEEAGARVE